jgi:hypothetical protein
MIIHYYVTDNAAFLAARAADAQKAAFIEGRCQGFADRFKAQALFTQGFAPQFAGITFTDAKKCPDPHNWTKRPDGIYVPRTKGLNDAARKRLKPRYEEFMQNYPKEEAMPWVSELLNLFNVTHEQVLKSGMLHCTVKHDKLWTRASLPLQGMDEITASAYVDGTIEKQPPVVAQEAA